MNKYQLRTILTLLITVVISSAINAQPIPATSGKYTIKTALSLRGLVTGKDLALSAAQSPEYTTLLQLLKASGLLRQASGKEAYTVFALPNAALTDLPDNMLRELLLPSSHQKQVRFLTYHIRTTKS